MPRMISNGSATTSQRNVLTLRDAWRRSVIERIGTLETFPNLGRVGRVRGTREIAFPPLPFVAIYEIREVQIVVLRILHGAQRWPSYGVAGYCL
jgi:plasmid stabilization system protein ParE